MTQKAPLKKEFRHQKYLHDSLAVSTAGEGEPLVFIHGFPFHRGMWFDSASLLAESCQTILPDMRGFGASASGEEPARTMPQFAEDIAFLIDEMRRLGEIKSERIVLCGLSMGGYIAMAFARRYPEKLAGLILCDTKTEADTPEAVANRRNLADRLPNEGTKILPGGEEKLLSPATFTENPSLVEKLRTMETEHSPQGIAAAARGMAQRTDSTSFLPEITVPVLVIGGEDDLLSPPEKMKKIAERLSYGTHIVIPKAGHVAPMEQPRLFAEAVKKWMNESLLVDSVRS